MNSLGINIRTGRPTKWPKHPYSTGTDHATFDCVWKGSWYTLASFSQHLKKKVQPGTWLLIDRMYHHYLVPQSEVHISKRQ